MSKLRESTIQVNALLYLKNYYQKKASGEVFCRKEVYTKRENGGKRADGLLCFQGDKGQYYTVSMEAKSHKTLGNLISFSNDNKLGKHCLISAAVVTALLLGFITAFLHWPWYFLVLTGSLAFVLSALICLWVFDWLELDIHKISSVVEQLKQYPANEQWIAYSKYTGSLLTNVNSNYKRNHLETLIRLCKANGFGLLLVGKKKFEVSVYPKFKKGDYLSYYRKEEEAILFLKQNIQDNSLV